MESSCSHDIYFSRFGTDHATISSTYGDTRTHHRRAPVSEPNIDFELDIKLDVDCGKCALHPKDTEAEVKRSVGKPCFLMIIIKTTEFLIQCPFQFLVLC